MQRNKVSIITPVLNRKATIERCIQSVLSQTYDNLEYIIVDGKSTDGTIDIIEKYQEKITILISETDTGVYDAINKGIKASSGDYILILNSDDMLIKEAIELSICAIRKEKADYSAAPAYIVDTSYNVKYIYWPNCFDKSAFIAQNPCAHETMLVSRKVYEEVGLYDIRLKIAADLKFELELIRKEYKVARLEEPILFFTHGGLSSNEEKAQEEIVRVLSEFIDLKAEYINGLVTFVNKGIPNQNTFKAISDSHAMEALPNEVLSYLLLNTYNKYLSLKRKIDRVKKHKILVKIYRLLKELRHKLSVIGGKI